MLASPSAGLKKKQNKTTTQIKTTSVVKLYLAWVDTMDSPEHMSSTTIKERKPFWDTLALTKNPHPSASEETSCLESSHTMYPCTRKWQSRDNRLNSWFEAKRTHSAGSVCGPHKTITSTHMGSGTSIHWERPRDSGMLTFLQWKAHESFIVLLGPS